MKSLIFKIEEIFGIENNKLKKMFLLSESEKNTLNHLVESIEPNQFKGLTTKIKYFYPNIYSKIRSKQIYLNIKTFSECIYLIINDLNDIPKCKHLSKKCTGKVKFKNIIEGYCEYCKACSSCNEDFKLKRKETNLDRYGVEYPTKSNFVKNKIKDTVMRKYGVENIKQIKK